MSITPDPALTDYATTGSTTAFHRLVDQHLPAVSATVARVLGAHADLAADVAQAVFILLARKAQCCLRS